MIRDDRCRQIVSIDSRPGSQPDERGPDWPYPDNTTERMRRNLAALPRADMEKLITIEASTETLDANTVAAAARPFLCFVDGEHTDSAVLRDARFCRALIPNGGWLAFHDTGIVYRGLSSFLDELRESGVEHRAYFLPDTILVVEFGPARLLDTRQVLEQIIGNAEGLIWTLNDNDQFRAVLGRPFPKLLRRFGALKI